MKTKTGSKGESRTGLALILRHHFHHFKEMAAITQRKSMAGIGLYGTTIGTE